MQPTGKSIREDLARAKAAFAKNEDLRTVQLIARALRAFISTKIASTDRIPIEGLLRESFANLNKLDRVRHYVPKGIPYLKGEEKKLCAFLIPLAKKIEADILRETLEAMRERKLRIDQYIIKGTKFLAEDNLLEAQRNFRSAVEDYVDEKGLFPLIASRLIDAGHFKPSFEYTKRAIEESPDNPRAYDFLLIAAQKSGEWTQAKILLEEAQRKHATQPLLDQALSVVESHLGNWAGAQSAAQRALANDPKLTEAKQVLAVATRHLAA